MVRQCSHPADYLEVREVLLSRDIIQNPEGDYTGGTAHYTVTSLCTRCKQLVNIYGTVPCR
jgi:hypothetical protein